MDQLNPREIDSSSGQSGVHFLSTPPQKKKKPLLHMAGSNCEQVVDVMKRTHLLSPEEFHSRFYLMEKTLHTDPPPPISSSSGRQVQIF